MEFHTVLLGTIFVVLQFKKSYDEFICHISNEERRASLWYILASKRKKKLGDPLDILGSYIFHSDNSFPKFLTQNFSVVALLREKKNKILKTPRELSLLIGPKIRSKKIGNIEKV